CRPAGECQAKTSPLCVASIFGHLRWLSFNGLKAVQLAHEEADYKDVRTVEQHACSKGWRVEAEMVIQCSGEPAAECHSNHRDHQQGGNAPGRLGRREQVE